ncbi:MAG TPA: tRNA pseudouridine(55) synthase TruB, partial [Burkholderiales bacterium]|nr:tRNA pseudouridine(55) synthase TruB [Burkholderiales bacterium]
YSALKRDGKPLYAYARAGTDIPREPRKVHIGRLELESIAGADVTVAVTCTKGTYVRVLAEDIGRKLGCGACLAGLTRTSVGGLQLTQAVSLAALGDLAPEDRRALLQPADTLVSALPRIDLDSSEAGHIRAGRPIGRSGVPVGVLARAYGPGGDFLGLVAGETEGRIVPKRLVSSAPVPAAAVGNGGKA